MSEIVQDQDQAPAPSRLLIKGRPAEVGRIRLGHKKVNRAGKTYPAKLEQFRLTSPAEQVITRAADVFGGTVAEWVDEGERKGYELFTDATTMDVVVRTTEPITQSYEAWAKGLCTHRCDGRWDSVRDVECTCCADPEQPCDHKLLTRLAVMLPAVTGMGRWRMETGGWYAAQELASAAEEIELARRVGARLVRATLALAPRTRKLLKVSSDGQPVLGKDGKQEVETRQFVVPVLTPDVGELMAQMIAVGVAAGARQIEAAAGSGPVPQLVSGAVREGEGPSAPDHKSGAEADREAASVPGHKSGRSGERGTPARGPMQSGDPAMTPTDRPPPAPAPNLDPSTARARFLAICGANGFKQDEALAKLARMGWKLPRAWWKAIEQWDEAAWVRAARDLAEPEPDAEAAVQ